MLTEVTVPDGARSGSLRGRLRPFGVGPGKGKRSKKTARRRRIALWGGGSVVFVVLLLGILAPWIAPYDPLELDLDATFAPMSAAHWLGTDANGRDVLSRLLFGARSSFTGVLIAVLVAGIGGSVWGLLAGYLGGVVDEVLMRLADAVISVPGIVLAIAITGSLGPSLFSAMVSVGAVFAPMIARLLRAQILPLRKAEFVVVARSFGVQGWRIALRHVLPNAMAPFIVQLCSLASVALIIEAALGFLGLGVQPPTASWGPDLARAYTEFLSDPYLTIAPGLAITLTAFAISQFGDGLRDVLRTG